MNTREQRAEAYAWKEIHNPAAPEWVNHDIEKAHIAGAQEEAAILDEAIAVLKEIANEDYRGNRSSGSVKAYQVLKKLGYME